MDLLRPTPRARQRPQPDRDPALEEFRRELGAWAEGKTDAELARVKLFADWVAETAVRLHTPQRMR